MVAPPFILRFIAYILKNLRCFHNDILQLSDLIIQLIQFIYENITVIQQKTQRNYCKLLTVYNNNGNIFLK